MRRKLTGALAVISLMLCISAAVLWARGRTRSDYPQFHPGRMCFAFCTGEGAMRFSVATWERSPAEPMAHWRVESPRSSMVESVSRQSISFQRGAIRLGPFGIDYGENGSGGRYNGLTMPYWSVMLLTALPAVIWLWQWRRQPMPPGLCRVCGYDLRATPERCPECGTRPANAS